jgi:hypothetical protein
MTSAIAAMEQRSSGQMGQPAACMIENNPVLSAASGFLGRAIMAPARGCGDALQAAADVETTTSFRQSTAGVDNFVGNLAARRAEPRKRWAGNGLLKT